MATAAERSRVGDNGEATASTDRGFRNRRVTKAVTEGGVSNSSTNYHSDAAATTTG